MLKVKINLDNQKVLTDIAHEIKTLAMLAAEYGIEMEIIFEKEE